MPKRERKNSFNVDIQNNRGLSKGDDPYMYLDLDYSGYHKNFIQ